MGSYDIENSIPYIPNLQESVISKREMFARNWVLQHTPVATYRSRAYGFSYRRNSHTISLADALGVIPQQGIFLNDRTNSKNHRCRYVPYPDINAIESYIRSSTPVGEVSAHWEHKHEAVPILVIEAKPAFAPIKAKL